MDNPKVLLPMERVGTLINKLQEQFSREEAVDKLSITAQLLLAELQMHKPANITSSKVAVVMPSIAIAKSAIETEPELSTVSSKQNAKEDKIAQSLLEPFTEIEIPTLIHQPAPVSKEELQVKEINELLINDIPEMNEQLKEYTWPICWMKHLLEILKKQSVSTTDTCLSIIFSGAMKICTKGALKPLTGLIFTRKPSTGFSVS